MLVPLVVSQAVSTLLLAAALFTSTNIDDLFVLAALFMNPAYRTREIIFGQCVGIALLFCLSLLASLLALAIPREYIGAAGLFPIFLGLKGLWERRKRPFKQRKASPVSESSKWGRPTMVALLTLTNGGDNISIYVPVFALRSRLELLGIAVTFAFFTGIWCYVAHRFANHPRLSNPVRKYGPLFVPYILIVIGVLIAWDAGTLHLLIRAMNKGI